MIGRGSLTGEDRMHTARDLLMRKSPKIVMIDPRRSVLQALSKMAEHGVGALLVADRDGNLSGILTEHDITMGAARFGEALLTRPVGELMTSDLITCEIGDDVVDALASMRRGRVRHLPVTDGREVVGVLSVRDMLALCIDAMRSDDGILRRQLANAAWPGGETGNKSWLNA
jgi:signal-transduction protein with cAMP-binding, CBS, and nucleotidyltransferase domain